MGDMIIVGFDGLIPIFEDEDKVPTLQEIYGDYTENIDEADHKEGK